MSLVQLFRFEWRYQSRHATYLAVVAASALLAVFLVSTGYGDDAVRLNSAYTVMQSIGLMSLWGVLVQTICTVRAALRDDEHQMADIVGSSPVSEFTLVRTRFGGALLAGTVVFLVFAGVHAVVPFVLADPARVGPLRPASYAWALALLLLPNLVLITGLLYSVARLTRSTLATYVTAIAIYGVYLVTAMLVDSPLIAGAAPPTPERLARAALLDPFGLSAFFEQTRYWTSAERETRLLSLSGHLLFNRVSWLLAAVLLLAWVSRIAPFRRRRERRSARRLEPDRAEAAPAIVALSPQPLASIAQHPAFWPATRSALGVDLRHLFGSRAFQALLLFWCFIATVESTTALRAGEYGTRIMASSGLLAGALSTPLALLGSLFVVFFAAEVVWRERLCGIAPLVDAAPSPTSAVVAAKLAALGIVTIGLGVFGFAVAIIVQLVSDGLAVEPTVYLAHLWFACVPLVLLAAASVFLHVLLQNRWLGMLATLVLVIVSRSVRIPWLSHPLLRFGSAPAITYSDLDGFGPVPASFSAFMLYWSALAILLVIAATRAWPRGMAVRMSARLANMFAAAKGGATWSARAAAACFVCTGAWLVRETVIVHRWESPEALAQWRVGYERTYRRISATPQPSTVAADIAVDFTPPSRTATVRGTLRLVNRTAQGIDSIWVTTRRDLESAQVTISGARPAGFDARYGVWRFVLDGPLLNGDSLRLTYRLTIDRGGIRAGDFDQDVAGNGSFLSSDIVVPSIGYRSTYELQSTAERRKRGLGPSTTAATASRDVAALIATTHREGVSPAWITLRTVLSTSADQVALGPGRLVRSWTDGDRRHFEYAVNAPMTPRFALASGRFVVERADHEGVPIEFWHDPRHAANASRIVAVARESVALLSSRLGPYPQPVLRMLEVPASSPFGAFATSGMIFLTEDRGVLADHRSGAADLLARRVAHEVSHQWWGHDVDPVPIPGSLIVVETLAKLAEQWVVASLRGQAALLPILAFDHDRYLSGRASDPNGEPTLLGTIDQDYMFYGKGAIAMHALSDALGDDAVIRALRRLRDEERGSHGAATASALYGYVRAEARTPQLAALVDEWFSGRVVYDLQVDTAEVMVDGERYQLRAVMHASRLGLSGAVPLDGEFVDVAVAGSDADGARALFAGPVEVRHGRMQLELALEDRPVTVTIDPLIRRIDRDRSNNQRSVVAGPGRPSVRR